MIRTQLGKKISKEKKALCFFLFQTPLLSPLSLLSPSSLPPLSLLSLCDLPVDRITRILVLSKLSLDEKGAYNQDELHTYGSCLCVGVLVGVCDAQKVWTFLNQWRQLHHGTIKCD